MLPTLVIQNEDREEGDVTGVLSCAGILNEEARETWS